jgi:hypothetical protein
MSGNGWRWEGQLHGIIPPLISPLDDPGAPDPGAAREAIAGLLDEAGLGAAAGAAGAR